MMDASEWAAYIRIDHVYTEGTAMSKDEKEMPHAAEDERPEDLAVDDAAAEDVRGGDGIAINYTKIEQTYTPQKATTPPKAP